MGITFLSATQQWARIDNKSKVQLRSGVERNVQARYHEVPRGATGAAGAAGCTLRWCRGAVSGKPTTSRLSAIYIAPVGYELRLQTINSATLSDRRGVDMISVRCQSKCSKQACFMSTNHKRSDTIASTNVISKLY